MPIVDEVHIICGVWDAEHHSPAWEVFEGHVRLALPYARVYVWRARFWPILQRDLILAFIDTIVKKANTPGKKVIVGHSFGGHLGMLVASKLTEATVVLVATINTPHRGHFGFFPNVLGTHTTQFPLITFSTWPDRLVWSGAEHPQSRRHTHYDFNESLWQDNHHLEVLRRRGGDIARIIREELER